MAYQGMTHTKSSGAKKKGVSVWIGVASLRHSKVHVSLHHTFALRWHCTSREKQAFWLPHLTISWGLEPQKPVRTSRRSPQSMLPRSGAVRQGGTMLSPGHVLTVAMSPETIPAQNALLKAGHDLVGASAHFAVVQAIQFQDKRSSCERNCCLSIASLWGPGLSQWAASPGCGASSVRRIGGGWFRYIPQLSPNKQFSPGYQKKPKTYLLVALATDDFTTASRPGCPDLPPLKTIEVG